MANELPDLFGAITECARATGQFKDHVAHLAPIAFIRHFPPNDARKTVKTASPQP